MVVEDPLTPGEIRRALDRLEQADRTLGDRVTQVASAALSAAVWAAERKALDEKFERHERDAEDDRKRIEGDIGGLRGDIKEIREERDKRSELTWTKILGLVGAAAALASVIIGVVGLTKGIN